MTSFGILLLRYGIARAQVLRATPRDDRGASALEWAIIAAVVVVAASVIGAAVYRIVQSKGAQLENCANQPVGATCAP